MMPPITIEQGLSIGERIAASTAPALVLAIVLLLVLVPAMWFTVRRQRKWVEVRVETLQNGISKCEASHRVCIANGQRRTSLLLQVLALAEPLVAALKRTEDVLRIADIRRDVEVLLREENDAALDDLREANQP